MTQKVYYNIHEFVISMVRRKVTVWENYYMQVQNLNMLYFLNIKTMRMCNTLCEGANDINAFRIAHIS